MHRLTRLSLACSLLALAPFVAHASVDIGLPVTATDGNWQIAVDPTGDRADRPGLSSWLETITSRESMYQQWFWFRIDSGTDKTTAEQPLQSLEWVSADQQSANQLSYYYGGADDPISAALNYSLTANSSSSSTIGETIEITNTSSEAIDFSFFAYTNLNLNGTPTDQRATRTPFGNSSAIVQEDFDGTTATVTDKTSGAAGYRWEINTYSDLLDSLEDNSTTTLANADTTVPETLGGGPQDFTHAFEWQFTGLDVGDSVTVELEKLVELGNGSSPAAPVIPADPEPGDPFEFDLDVEPDQPWWIDPEVAIGYEYKTTDINFASVTVPGPGVASASIGDNLYTVHLYDTGLGDYDPDPVASLDGSDPSLNTYDFASGGVDRFLILGIETSAGLDPDDPTVFMTGVGFVSSGNTNVSMLARRQFVEAPVPGTLALALIGGIGLHVGLRRRRAAGTLARA